MAPSSRSFISSSPLYVLLFYLLYQQQHSSLRCSYIYYLHWCHVVRYTYIFVTVNDPKLTEKDEQFLFIVLYSIICIYNINEEQYVLCLFYSYYVMWYILLIYYFIMFHLVWWLLKSVIFCLEILFVIFLVLTIVTSFWICTNRTIIYIL